MQNIFQDKAYLYCLRKFICWCCVVQVWNNFYCNLFPKNFFLYSVSFSVLSKYQFGGTKPFMKLPYMVSWLHFSHGFSTIAKCLLFYGVSFTYSEFCFIDCYIIFFGFYYRSYPPLPVFGMGYWSMVICKGFGGKKSDNIFSRNCASF